MTETENAFSAVRDRGWKRRWKWGRKSGLVGFLLNSRGKCASESGRNLWDGVE